MPVGTVSQSKLLRSCTVLQGFIRHPPVNIVMSNVNHLQQTYLSSLVISLLNEFSLWLYTSRFREEGQGLQRYVDPDLSGRIEPLLVIHSLVYRESSDRRTRGTCDKTSLEWKLALGLTRSSCFCSFVKLSCHFANMKMFNRNGFAPSNP